MRRKEGKTYEKGMTRRRAERKREERPRNLRFHLVTRACPSRFSSSPCGCNLDGGWGPRETRPPAGSWARHPSFSLSLSLTQSVSPFHLAFPLHRSRSGGGGDSPRGPFPAPLYNILALCFSSLVILANDYEFLSARRESRGTSPRLEHVTLAERIFGWTGWIRLGDPNG